MTQDITYLLGGILKTAALHAGLYQPDVYAHFSRTRYSLSPDEIREAARVWCCIYVCIERYVPSLSLHFVSFPAQQYLYAYDRGLSA